MKIFSFQMQNFLIVKRPAKAELSNLLSNFFYILVHISVSHTKLNPSDNYYL